MTFKRMQWIAGSAPQRVHSVFVINKVFSSFQDKEYPTYNKSRKYFVSDMIIYLDI